RRKGYNFFKSKAVLLTVVIMCILDCALVLGELTLDLYKVKVTLEESEKLTGSTELFISAIKEKHKDALELKEYAEIYNMLMAASINWNSTDSAITENLTVSSAYMSDRTRTRRDTSQISMTFNNVTKYHKKKYSIEEHIAHAFHLASTTILGILAIEVFDAFIVVTSFIADAVLVVIISDYNTRDFVFILAFLLPWRVIRVVDSLVVAVKDHEHFRLKLVYKRKKKIQSNLRETEVRAQIFQYQCNALRRLCIAEGLDEWKIDQCVKAEQKYQSTLGKRKTKLKIDNSSLCLLHDRDSCPSARSSPRPSIPSLDFHGLKLSHHANGHSLKHNDQDVDIEEMPKDKTIS
ncbi:hypothetical protein FSP39_015846, partial [Pinctada imbricata]